MVDSVSPVCFNYPLAFVPIRPRFYHLRVLSRFIGFTYLRPVYWTWTHTFVPLGNLIPSKLQIPLAAVLVVMVILMGTFLSPQSSDNNYKNRGISILGLFVFYVILYITSANRSKIVWRTVIVGLLCQYLLALFVLRTQVGYDIFDFISFLARYEH